jgi:predicted phage terminase large subunit-like protein
MTVTSPYEYAARILEGKRRRYATPGKLAAALDPDTGTSPALDLIDQELVGLMAPDSVHNALAVYMPPQEGKSQRVSRRFSEWLLDHDPALRIAIVSYGEELAVRWGRTIRTDATQHPCLAENRGQCHDGCGGLHISIRQDSSAAGRWQTPEGGGIYCVGIGGPLTGQPVDVLIIDDPVKDRAAAESETIRNSTWDWFESVALTRLAGNARVVLIQTRWHEDDLAGRIESRPSPLKWHTIKIPAIAGDDDPLGRAPGEELTSVRARISGYFRNLLATMSAYVFSGVYQQNPVAPEGNFFRRATFRYWRQLAPWNDGRPRIDLEGQIITLTDCWRFATMDFAASVKTSANYTVAAVWAVAPAGDLILLDRRRGRVPDHQHFALLTPLRQRWQFDQTYVEANFWSDTFVKDAMDAGIPVAKLTADTDKVTRAIPAAGRLHSGKVWFPAVTAGCECGNCPDGVWLDEWCDELAIFYQGTHDDQVDVFSYAARVLTAEWTPAASPPRQGRSPHEAAVATAHSAATGNGHGDLDIMGAQW